MRTLLALATCATACLGAGVATADPWKDESGHGRWRGEYHSDYRRSDARDYRDYKYKEEFRYGACKVERKWDRGGYKEEVKCDGRRR